MAGGDNFPAESAGSVGQENRGERGAGGAARIHQFSSVIDAGNTGQIILPGGPLIFVAEYIRAGPDLILVGPDGDTVLIRGYFSVEPPPDLVLESGAVLSADVVMALAGPAAPGQYAQAVATGEQPIGTVEATDGDAFATRVDGTRVTLAVGDPLFQGDVVETGDGASLSVVFVDNTTFAMDENGRMVLDELIFDLSTEEGTSVFALVKGTFVFVSGQIAQSGPDAMTVTTPTIGIGIRGTFFVVSVELPDSPLEGAELAAAILNSGYVATVEGSVLSGDKRTLSIARRWPIRCRREGNRTCYCDVLSGYTHVDNSALAIILLRPNWGGRDESNYSLCFERRCGSCSIIIFGSCAR